MSGDGATLTYFPGRGYGEIVRITLCLGKVPFSQKFLTKKEQFEKLKTDGKLLFGQVPLLEIDGLNMVQSVATVRYAAEKGGLIPADPKQRARMNMLYDGARECYNQYSGVGFAGSFDDLKGKIQASLDKYLPILDKELQSSTSGYIVGDSVSMADAALLELLLACVEYFTESSLSKYSALQKFYGMMMAKPEVVQYIKDVRQKANHEEYIKMVKGVLGW